MNPLYQMKQRSKTMAISAKQNDNKVVTGEVRLSYTHVFEPFSNDPEKPKKFSTAILIPKSDTATINAIKKAALHAAKNGKAFGGKVPPQILKNPATTLHDGDAEADLEKNPEYAGHYYMTISSNVQPGIVDRDKMPILDTSEVYSGCYARVAMGAFAYSNSGNKGVSFGLNHVQKLRDGENLAGMSRAEDEFDDLDDADLEDDDEGLI
jgi:hypothetical protein